ncbi:hypothetical protein H8S90_21310 [Olivibacter sp. SDN3]|uniref:hypothetical protein n=1 Tax=Olivibacter sp. SDN3 TaxID=2764720 RepID=UPI001651AF52|nr:hypothetical protein [Olivibacter sp. SDN3]QNL49251.1 hypothetical protein H8S90_21310 [Olivibacter sp. SDN3]
MLQKDLTKYQKYQYPFNPVYLKDCADRLGNPGVVEGAYVVFDIIHGNEINGKRTFENVDEFKAFLSKYYEFKHVEGWEGDGGHHVVYQITRVL